MAPGRFPAYRDCRLELFSSRSIPALATSNLAVAAPISSISAEENRR